MPIKYKQKKQKNIYFYKFFVVIISLLAISFVLYVAPNYIKDDITDKTNLIINNNNVTKNLKNDIVVENNVVYISQDDMKTYFDGEIYYDSKYNQIVVSSDTKLAVLPIDNKQIVINGSNVTIYASAKKIDDKYYIPFSEISKNVFNAETEYIKDTNIVVISSLDKELTNTTSTKNNNIKYKPTVFSRTIEKVNQGNNLILISSDNGWSKVQTENGKIGYVKTSTLTNIQKVRDNLTIEKQITGNVSLVWDYFSEYVTAPSRTGTIQGVNVVSPSFVSLKKQGQGDIEDNIGTQGISYINWAHNNGYKVWSMVSNNSMKETTSEILGDYNLRKKLIDNILKEVQEYDFDGINLDFENVYESDKDNYSKLIIELAPQLRDMGKVLSVDVTAPDGSADWSLCFDRHVIGKVADYIVFMAYDEYGSSSSEAGTTAGYDWVEANVKKFISQEEVDSSKIILGMPFYTRIWKISGSSISSDAIDMKNIYSKIPSNANIQWLNDLKQNYTEYEKDNMTYKVWIEDTKSITEKLSLISDYNLAGGAYWEKDRETDDIWKIISEKLNVN